MTDTKLKLNIEFTISQAEELCAALDATKTTFETISTAAGLDGDLLTQSRFEVRSRNLEDFTNEIRDRLYRITETVALKEAMNGRSLDL